MPDNFLTSFEMARLNIDNYGSISQLTDGQKMMIIGMFMFGKVLVAMILLQPELHSGLRSNFNLTLKTNMRIIATILHQLMTAVIEEYTDIVMQSKEMFEDGISEHLYKSELIQPFV